MHQCERFCNNPGLVHERAIIRIKQYLARNSMYMDLPHVNCWLSTCGAVYRHNKEKVIKVYAHADFVGGWDQ